jgi:hypothetical protein
MQRPAKNIEIGYKKWKGLTGDDFSHSPAPAIPEPVLLSERCGSLENQAAVNA